MTDVDHITIVKKTDQLNYEDFLGGVTRIITIAGVKRGTKEQQYDIQIEGDKRVWRPSVTMLKLLVAAWGDDARQWVGRRVALYGDPTVRFGPDIVGGIRISHLSHIDGPLTERLSETRGKRKPWTVDPLPDTPAPATPTLAGRITGAVQAFDGIGVTVERLTARFGAPANWTTAELDASGSLFAAIRDGKVTAAEAFPQEES